MKQKPLDYLLNNKPTTILIEVASKEGVYISKLKKVSDTTYAHLFFIVRDLEKAGLLNSEKKGRVRLLDVTKKGRKVANLLVQLKCI